jgi:hypothetical protein
MSKEEWKKLFTEDCVTVTQREIEEWKMPWPVCLLVMLVCIFTGFFIAWLSNNTETRYYGMVVAIIIIVGMKFAKDFLLHFQQRELRDIALLQDQEEKLLQRKEKLLANQNKLNIPVMKKEKKYAFTSEDFADDAQNLLIKPVRQARRTKAKVTGKGLIETFLKGIH